MDQGLYRDIDSVSSKWRKMSGLVNRFFEEYNKIYSSGRRSWMSDEDVFKKALDVYKSNHGTTFAHVRAWEIIRTTQKWTPVPNEVEMAKRQRTSESGSYGAGGSDARCHINLNDDAECDEEEYAVKEAERPRAGTNQRRRRRQRKKSKRSIRRWRSLCPSLKRTPRSRHKRRGRRSGRSKKSHAWREKSYAWREKKYDCPMIRFGSRSGKY
ncbi:hypothetical protein HanIR_Chr07g0305211 [Helianthus annuus]|nr:hypothetical protein HanIR_Chr07g0305211 [Helianthus annuus]